MTWNSTTRFLHTENASTFFFLHLRRSRAVPPPSSSYRGGIVVLRLEVLFQAQPDLPRRVSGKAFRDTRRHADFEFGLTFVAFDGIRTAQPLSHLDRPPARVFDSAFHDHNELVRQPAAGDISRPNLWKQPRRKLFQHLVSRFAAQRFVEAAKIIDIEEQHAELPARCKPQIDLPFQFAPICKSGERI